MEEGIVRDDILGSRNLGSRDYWVGVRGLSGPVLEQLRAWARTCASGTGVRAEHRRSGDPGLWARQ